MLMTQTATSVGGALPPLTRVPARPADAESELVARLQCGDAASYEEVVRRYGGPMLAVARRILRHEDDARDAVQDAFLQAFRAVHQFRAEARLSTWLHRIVANAALMRLRSAGRRPEVPIDELLPNFDDEGVHSSEVRALPLSVEAVLENAETRVQVRRCLEHLPQQYRAIIDLRDLQELSTAETAAILGITENAAKIRLHRAHQALRTLLVRRLSDEK